MSKPTADWRKILRENEPSKPKNPKPSVAKAKPKVPVAKAKTPSPSKPKAPVAKVTPTAKIPAGNNDLDNLLSMMMGLGQNPSKAPVPTDISSGIVPPPPVPAKTPPPAVVPKSAPVLPPSVVPPPRRPVTQGPQLSPPQFTFTEPVVPTNVLPGVSPNVPSPNLNRPNDQDIQQRFTTIQNALSALQLRVTQYQNTVDPLSIQINALRKDLDALKNKVPSSAEVVSEDQTKIGELEVQLKSLNKRLEGLRSLKDARCTDEASEVAICDRVTQLERKVSSYLGVEGSLFGERQGTQSCAVATGAVPLFVSRSLVKRPEPIQTTSSEASA